MSREDEVVRSGCRGVAHWLHHVFSLFAVLHHWYCELSIGKMAGEENPERLVGGMKNMVAVEH